MNHLHDDVPRRPVIEILDPMIVAIQRLKTPADRILQASRLWEAACLITRGSVRQQHPERTEIEVLREAARRLSHGATERVPR